MGNFRGIIGVQAGIILPGLMETLGVIERVYEPTEWCAWMVVPKGNEAVRMCVPDYAQ